MMSIKFQGFLPVAAACWSISTTCKKVKVDQPTNHSFKSGEGSPLLKFFVVGDFTAIWILWIIGHYGYLNIMDIGIS